MSEIINTGTNAAWIQGVVYHFETALMREGADFFDNMSQEQIHTWIIQHEGFENFPPNLTLSDHEFSRTNVANGFAFHCSQTDETVIGIAGSNNGTTQQFIMDWRRNIANTGFGGGLPDYYFDQLRILHERLETNGATVSAVTGHSLGGGTAEFFGMKYGIQPISFNAAPIRVFANDFRSLVRWLRSGNIAHNSDVIPIRFVTHNDFLQWEIMTRSTNWETRTFIMPGGSGHGNDNFRILSNLDTIGAKFQLSDKFSDQSSKIKIHFGDNGSFKIPEGMRVAGNLLGNGGQVSVTPESLHGAVNQMRQSIAERFDVKSSGIRLATKQNNHVSASQATRLDNLVQSCFRILDQAGLDDLFRLFPKTMNLNDDLARILGHINGAKLPSLINSFMSRHPSTNSQTSWLIDGNAWSQMGLDSIYHWVRSEVEFLENFIKNNSFEAYYQNASNNEYHRRATSSVEYAYISTINSAVIKMRDSILGVGSIRNNKSDAIVNTLDELFNNLNANLDVAINKNEELAVTGTAIANNATHFDHSVTFGMDGNNHVGISMVKLSKQLQLAFFQNELLKTDENVISAMYEQADFRSSELNAWLWEHLSLITRKLDEDTNTIVGRMQVIIDALNRLNQILTQRISSSTPITKSQMNPAGEMVETTTFKRQTHLTLGEYLPQQISSGLHRIEQQINTMLPDFEKLRIIINPLFSQLLATKPPIKDEIYHTIYPRDEMLAKLSTAKAMAILIETTASEYERLADDITAQMQGKTIRGYAGEIRIFVQFLRRISEGIRTDFCVTLN